MSRGVLAAFIAIAIALARPAVAFAADVELWTARAIATVLAETGDASTSDCLATSRID